MAVQNTKIGAILGLIGSIILLITGLVGITLARNYSYIPGFPTFLSYITAGVTLAFSAFGIFGTVLVFRDNPSGYTYLLIAGIAGIIGSFIPIYTYDTGYGFILFYLNSTFIYADLVLMLVGGILGFALAEPKERKEF